MSDAIYGAFMMSDAIYGAFMMEGFRETSTIKNLPNSIEGGIGLVAELCSYVEPIKAMVAAAESILGEGNHPGIFDYEVTSPFGEFVGSYIEQEREFPSRELCINWLKEACTTFFIRFDDDDAPRQHHIKAAIYTAV